MKTFTLLFPVVFCVCIGMGGCSRTKKMNTELLTPDKVTQKQRDFLTSKGLLVENEELVYVYSLTKIKKNCVVLTKKNIAVYKDGYIQKEALENIFDMAQSHSITPEKKSSITIYKKDNTEFYFEFAGGSDVDDQFFARLKSLWREALDKKETVKADSSGIKAGGEFLGIQKK